MASRFEKKILNCVMVDNPAWDFLALLKLLEIETEVIYVSTTHRAFEKVINPITEPDRREQIITAPLEDQKADTPMMVNLVKWLFAEAEEV